jgi:hypothetical protein
METYGAVTAPAASINAASFKQLWLAYFNVMAETSTAVTEESTDTPIDEVASAAILDPFVGSQFQPAAPFAPVDDLHFGLMFRSSIRDHRADQTVPPGDPRYPNANAVVRLKPFEQMRLRAALAAVNAEDLRDSDDIVTRRRIKLRVNKDNNGAVTLLSDVVVFGTERQPYITEVYANTDPVTPGTGGPNPGGYVAIELHNPSPDAAVDIGNWSVGLIDRRDPDPVPVPAPAVAKPTIQITNMDGTTTAATRFRFPVGTVIPAGGYLVLENYDAAASGATTGAPATHRPPGVVPPAHRAIRRWRGE